jgi:hypothetical protein
MRSAPTEESRKRNTRQLFEKVNAFLNMPRTVQSIRTHIGAQGMRTIKDNRLQSTARFMDLWAFKQVAGMWERGNAASGSAGSGNVRQTTLG